MISEIKIQTGKFEFSQNAGANKLEYPITLKGKCFYRRKDGSVDYLRDYEINEVWGLDHARELLWQLWQAVEAVVPSSAELDWDY